MSEVIVYGADWCGDCRRSEALLKALNVKYEKRDVEQSAEYTEEARGISGRTNIPVILFADGKHLVEPTDPELHAELTIRGLI
ncbi:MAG: glutaredoxin family protein [Micrococcales bacterium]|jgi:glutaredoxin|nr:glutaredoxin family protein [Microbacteriaceae bacterium]NBR24370.1 glutaredoxin family protein [Micrococcales bacterium]